MLLVVLVRILHHKREWQYFGEHAVAICMQHVVNTVAQCWTDWTTGAQTDSALACDAIQTPMLRLKAYIQSLGELVVDLSLEETSLVCT